MNNLKEFTKGNIKLLVCTNQKGDVDFDVEQAITFTAAVKDFKVK